MMRMLFVFAVAVMAGCSSSRQGSVQDVCDCFCGAAKSVIAVGDRPIEPAPPKKCCGKCGGTGWVLSGDKIEKVPCECNDTCECKKKKPSSCPNGKCPVRR